MPVRPFFLFWWWQLPFHQSASDSIFSICQSKKKPVSPLEHPPNDDAFDFFLFPFFRLSIFPSLSVIPFCLFSIRAIWCDFHAAVGRSMVIHNPNGAAARLACGNVIPQQAKDVIMLLHTDPRTFSAQYFKQRVAATLGLASQNVMFLRALPHGPCTAVSFVLDGPGAEENSQHLLRSNLGTYTHEPRCAHPSQIVTAAPFTDPNRGDRGSAARHGLQLGNSIVLLLTAFCLAVYLHESWRRDLTVPSIHPPKHVLPANCNI